MNYDELEEARQRFESARLKFIAMELEIAVTFGKLALDAASVVLFHRYVHKACVAHNTAVRLLAGAPLKTEMEERVGLSMSRLEWIFPKLREREMKITQTLSKGIPFGDRMFAWATEEYDRERWDEAERLPAMQEVSTPEPNKPLSPREEQIVRRVADGKCNKEIARELGLSTRTVETYRLRLMRKLELNCTSEVVKFAIRNHLANG